MGNVSLVETDSKARPSVQKSLETGAKVVDDGVAYSVWAPDHKVVRVEIVGADGLSRNLTLDPRDGGYAVGLDRKGTGGDLYFLDLGKGKKVPDFASRFQPKGIKGPSMVVDPRNFRWTDDEWATPGLKGQVIYELHIGTFTPEGTYSAAIERLSHIRDLGATAVEIMPLAERAGTRNWGYDGVFLFAPTWTYGTPDQLRAFVDAAHMQGLAVILDVVFNHLGPEGNVGPMLAEHYFHTENDTPWGQNFDLDGPHSCHVRAFLKSNIQYWMSDYHIDGFRMDATHAIPDRSPRHLLAELADLVHERGGFIIAEDERNEASILEASKAAGWGFDGVWADDFHHSARVSQTGADARYFEPFLGTADEIARTIHQGWLYCGEIVKTTGKARGTPCRHLSPEQFIYCISNHDQIGNRPLGDRLNHAINPESYRAASLFFCLLPYTPLLFMGQEWAAKTPFNFFTDFEGELGQKMAEYRLKEFERLGMAVSDHGKLSDPQSLDTFLASKLNWAEVQEKSHKDTLKLYSEALALRANLFPLGNPSRDSWKVESKGDVVILNYWLEPRNISVQFALKNSQDLGGLRGRVLKRSSDRSDAELRAEAHAETVVLEISD